jgi:hypothetical protein
VTPLRSQIDSLVCPGPTTAESGMVLAELHAGPHRRHGSRFRASPRARVADRQAGSRSAEHPSSDRVPASCLVPRAARANRPAAVGPQQSAGNSAKRRPAEAVPTDPPRNGPVRTPSARRAWGARRSRRVGGFPHAAGPLCGGAIARSETRSDPRQRKLVNESSTQASSGEASEGSLDPCVVHELPLALRLRLLPP